MRRLALLVLAICAVPQPVLANGAPSALVGSYGGMGLSPIKGRVFVQQKHVALVDERLWLRLGKSSYSVTVRYRFKNTGSTQTVRVAFPHMTAVHGFRVFVEGKAVRHTALRQHSDIAGYYHTRSGDEPYPLAAPFNPRDLGLDEEQAKIYMRKHRFARKVDGDWESGSETVERLTHNPRWANFRLFTLTFPPGKTVRVEIRYQAAYAREIVGQIIDPPRKNDDDRLYARFASYILQTGRYWKGCLDSLKIEVTIDGLDLRALELAHNASQPTLRQVSHQKYGNVITGYAPNIRPAGWRLTGNTLRWQFRKVCLSKQHDLKIRLIEPNSYDKRWRHLSVRTSSLRSASGYFDGELFATILGKPEPAPVVIKRRQHGMDVWEQRPTPLRRGIYPSPHIPFSEYRKHRLSMLFGAALYSPLRALDGGPSGWCEGERGPGLGQWMELRFHKRRTTRRLSLIGGLGDPVSWRQHPRIKRLAIALDGGKPLVITLRDTPRPHSIILPSGFRRIRLTIRQVYPGPSNHTCLRMLRLVAPTPPPTPKQPVELHKPPTGKTR